MPGVDNNHIVETSTEARGASAGQGGRSVLAFSMIGAVIVALAVFLYFVW